MQIASLVVFALLSRLPGHGILTGTWHLDRITSDFGAADAPQLFALHLWQTGNLIAATIFTVDASGQRVTYRECRVEPQLDGLLSCVTPDGVTAEEAWQVTAANELTITRVITTKPKPVRQRLVLARSTLLE
jgi:hypothetical protein